ncbi:MAG: thioredoxin domain-containing protein, partial [Desulfomonilaceae bacterium]
SIGYSTCHWCHVMEKESFEDPEVAASMNDTFVAIKVDREERPDIDHLYMTVCQMMTGGGGWPLNVVLTPDKKPFFAGTYFPKYTLYGRIGMLDLSRRIKELWTRERHTIMGSAEKVVSALHQIPNETPGDLLDDATLARAYRELEQRYDERFGGFGTAPKFPTPHNLLFLFRYWYRTRTQKALEMALETLKRISLGGIHDHIGFGFHRYSTDDHWLVPHFEKMLYDQALLAIAFVEAYQITHDAEYKATAEKILQYVLRDMTAAEGAFYSAEDADSEGEEGKFYTWSWDEIEQRLDPEEFRIVQRIFNITREGNYREEASGELVGRNILHMTEPIETTARGMGLPVETVQQIVENARQKLFLVRSRRIRPHKDDKILADWNGLMIAALAKAAIACGNEQYAIAAARAADFILKTMRGHNGRLLHRYRDNHAGVAAGIDDYAFLIWGLINLYEAVFEERYLRGAVELTAEMMALFWDESAGGFYLTANDSEKLLIRAKDIYDGATPSGNSAALLCLKKLAAMTASTHLADMALRLEKAFAGNVRKLPSAYTFFLCAVEQNFSAPQEIVLVGKKGDPTLVRMIRELGQAFLPHKVVIFKPADRQSSELERLAPYVQPLQCIDGKTTAYVCKNYQCSLPTTDADRMMEQVLGSMTQ